MLLTGRASPDFIRWLKFLYKKSSNPVRIFASSSVSFSMLKFLPLGPRMFSNRFLTIFFDSLIKTESSLFNLICVTKNSSLSARILVFSLTQTSFTSAFSFQNSQNVSSRIFVKLVQTS